jgi:hypothetical protein
MAGVLGVHEIDLGPGADPAEFERLAAAVVAQPAPAGMKVRVLKGERGARTGQYVVIIEMDSLEVRNHFFPVEHEDSTELLAYFEANPAAAGAWRRFIGFEPSTDVDTDYVVVAE